MKLLLDENLSPTLVPLLAAKGVAAGHVAHLGRSGGSDPDLWRLAFESDHAIATLNARDFLRLAAGSILHPGLFVLRIPGLRAEGQWTHLEPAIGFALAEEAAGRDLVNRVVEIAGVGEFDCYPLPG